MKKFTVPTREEVAPANQTIFDNLTKALGFVPNLYATIAYSDNALSRYLAYQNVIIEAIEKANQPSQLDQCKKLTGYKTAYRIRMGQYHEPVGQETRRGLRF